MESRIGPTLQTVSWLCFEALLPVLFVIAMWPVSILNDVSFAFEKTFSGADLVPMAVFLIISVSSANLFDQLTTKKGPVLSTLVISVIGLAVAVILLFAYCFVKAYAIKYKFPECALNQLPCKLPPVDDAIRSFSIFSLVAMVFSLVFCLYLKVSWLRRVGRGTP